MIVHGGLSAQEVKTKVTMEMVLAHCGSDQIGKKWRCPQPANHSNGDSHPSASIHNGRLTCHSQDCFKGDDIFAVIGKIENLSDFNSQKVRIEEMFLLNGHTHRKKIVASYDYLDEHGNLLFQAVRYTPKDFKQRRPDGNGGWTWSLKGVRLILFKLREVLAAQNVLVCEGEKDVLAAYTLGLPEGWAATCNPMGAGKWNNGYSESLREKACVICPDRDEPGQRHGELVAQRLQGIATDIRWLGLPSGKDLSDWAAQEGTEEGCHVREAFHKLLHDSPAYVCDEPEDLEHTEHSHLIHAVLDYVSLTTLELPERTRYLPFLPQAGSAMVFGPRGIGKTFFQLSLAASLVTATPFLRWTISEAVGVLYIDGEMALDELRERMTTLLPEPPKAPLLFLTGEYVYHKLKRDLVLTEEKVRDEISTILDEQPAIRVVIFDNISCLFSGIDEDRKRDWEPIAAWLIRLRHRGLTTVLSHHSGKAGQQRGTSGREDSLDTVIQLKQPAGYEAQEGCHFELHFTKCRSTKGEDVASLDVKLQEQEGQLCWTWKPLDESLTAQARQLFEDGVTSPSDLAEELEISKGYASKLLRKFRAASRETF